MDEFLVKGFCCIILKDLLLYPENIKTILIICDAVEENYKWILYNELRKLLIHSKESPRLNGELENPNFIERIFASFNTNKVLIGWSTIYFKLFAINKVHYLILDELCFNDKYYINYQWMDIIGKNLDLNAM